MSDTPTQTISEMTDEQIRELCHSKAKLAQDGINEAAVEISKIVNAALANIATATAVLIQENAYFRELEVLMSAGRLSHDRMNDIFNHISKVRKQVAELAKQRVSSKQ